MATVTFVCPQCRTNLKTSQRIDSDQEVRCPKCDMVFPAPPETSYFDPDETHTTAHGNLEEPDFLGSALPRSGSNRTKWILLCSAMIVVLFTAGTAFLAWKTIENWGRNEGTGREDPLAFVPPESTLVVGVDLGALAAHPDWADQVEKGIRQLSRSSIFWDDCKANTGVEFRELFDQVILAFKLDGLNRNEAPHLTLIAHSRVPFNQNRIRDSDPDMYRQVANGKTYYKRQDGNLLSFSWLYMPSDRILVLSSLPEFDFLPLLEHDGTQPLVPPDEIQRIQAVQGNPFWAEFPFYRTDELSAPDHPTTTMRQDVKRAFAALVTVAPTLTPVIKTLSEVQAASASAQWEGEKMTVTLDLDCLNEEIARKGSSRLQEFKGKKTIGGKGLPNLFTRNAQAFLKLVELIQEVWDHAGFSTQADQIRITARITPPASENLPALGAQMSRILGFGSNRQSPSPPPQGQGGRRGFQPGGPPKQVPPGNV